MTQLAAPERIAVKHGHLLLEHTPFLREREVLVLIVAFDGFAEGGENAYGPGTGDVAPELGECPSDPR